jgi:hypothetical protein
MKTDLNLGKIAQLLTQSSRQLDGSTLSALVDARQKALKRQLVRAPVFALSTGSETHSPISDSIQQWVVSVLFVAMLIVGTSFWHHVQEQQISELDVAILTDDLPIEVFVD